MELFVILNYQNLVQHNVNRAALSIGRNSYSLDKIKELSDVNQITNDLGLSEELILSGINIGYAWNKIFTQELKEYTKKVDVTNGINGISIITSDINEDNNGINDIKVNYRISADILGNNKIGFCLSNRCYFRSWIGKSISEDMEQETINQQKVYITKNGKVYHLKRDCTHINIVITKVEAAKIEGYRNSNGAKYYACEVCVKNAKATNTEVYITTDGRKYHNTKECGKIERSIIEMDKSEVGSKN